MGILGRHPIQEVLEKLRAEVIKWENADTPTPVLPFIHYIAVTAQRSPCAGGKYELHMPLSQIDKAIALAKEIDGIVLVGVQ